MNHWVTDANAALVTDLYELTMAQVYFAEGMTQEATFDLFVRKLPARRRFLVAAGLDDALRYLEELHFSDSSLEYLESLGMFTDDFLDSLGALRFTGEVWAMPEGETAFANEPIMRVTAPLPQAQLAETFLLNCIGYQTMIASKAARVAIACGGRRFVDFSARRDHGADAALKGARAAFIGGAVGTSMTLAGQLFGIPVSGTMAHSFVMSYQEEAEAFRAFARVFPENAILLIDTYDTEEGARIAARVAQDLSQEGIRVRGVRLDSGDLARLSTSVRKILDDAGQPEIQIFVSGDLDEHQIAEMVAGGCPVDAFGVGTRLGTSSDAPYLGVVYKMVAQESRPVIKLSAGKMTLPGRKQVWRFDDHDLLALEDEPVAGGRALLEEVMVDGKRSKEPEPLGVLQQRREKAVDALPSRLRTLQGRERAHDVRLSPALQGLSDEMRKDKGSR